MVGGLPTYSVNVAVRYLIQKMCEERIQIYLDTDNKLENSSAQKFSEDKPKYSQTALRNLIDDVVQEEIRSDSLGES